MRIERHGVRAVAYAARDWLAGIAAPPSVLAVEAPRGVLMVRYLHADVLQRGHVNKQLVFSFSLFSYI